MFYSSCQLRVVSILVLISASICASESTGPRVYQGNTITPESIAGLMPAMPGAPLQACMSWIAAHENIYKNMLAPSEPPSQFTAHQKEVNEQLKSTGIKNLSRWNFVVEPTPGYLMKVSGPINRICNLLAHNDKRQDVDYTDEELDTAIKSRPHTYQTVSNAAHYLLCKQAIENEKLKHVIVPTTYLITTEAHAHDGNSCIVQQALPSTAIPLGKLSSEERANIPVHAIRDGLTLIKKAGLWDTTGTNVLYDKVTESICISDIEQPNNSKPEHFFHQNGEKYRGNTGCGFDQFTDQFKEAPTILQAIDEWAAKDIDLQTWKISERLHAHIAQLLKGSKGF